MDIVNPREATNFRGRERIAKGFDMSSMSCSVDGCERGGYLTRGWCKMHYKRWKKSGDTGQAAPTRGNLSCVVVGCGRKHLAKGWCTMHYQRTKSLGDPGSAEPLKLLTQGSCEAAGCESEARSRNLCVKHYKRLQTHGESGLNRVGSRDEGHVLSYGGAHMRVRTARGSAPVQSCLRCGDPADHWAYGHNDLNALRDERGYLYSLDPSEYIPLCVLHHKELDMQMSRPESSDSDA